MNGNLSKIDMFFRFFVGLTIIALVLAIPTTPVWLVLVATYPMFTGILKLDPIYAAYLALAKPSAKTATVNTGHDPMGAAA